MDIGLLALHVVVGLFLVGHGAQKLLGVLGGHGLDGTAGFFESIGLRPGRLHAAGAGAAELAGGALLALGLLTPLAAALVIAVMVAAIATVHLGKGPWNSDQGWELNVTYIAAAFALAAVGAGELSLDNALGLDVAGTAWALGALGAGLAGGIGAVASGRLAARRGGDAQPSAA